MRTPRRLAVATAVLGGGLLLAGPAAAQPVVDCDAYPDNAACIIDEDLSGSDEGAASEGAGSEGEDNEAGGGTQADAASLPFTGGEVTLIALAGTAALGGGIALVAAGRKRKTV